MSNRVYRALHAFSPHIEKYSIDESFLSLPAHVEGCDLKERMYRYVGIPVSVGVGTTKTLAKAANHLAKNVVDYRGVYYMPELPEQDEVLHGMPVKELWGIGRRWAKTLRAHGILTVKDLKYTSDTWIKKHMNVVGLRIAFELRGIPCLKLEEVTAKRKHSICSQSFEKAIVSFEEMKEAVSTFASTASARLRRHNQVASLLHVFIRTNRFGATPPFHASYDTVLIKPTASAPAITKTALQCLERIFEPGPPLQKAGVILSGLESAETIQTNLFDSRDPKKDAALMSAFDTINHRFGNGSVKIGSEGMNPSWSMKRDFKSPNYTTRLSDLQVVS